MSDKTNEIHEMASPTTALCQSCGKNKGMELHPCPYNLDINNDNSCVCNCCDECAYECARDI